MAAAMFLFFWQIVVWTHWRPETVLPSPFTVLKSLSSNVGDITKASGRTLFRGLKGFAVAIALGTFVGMAVASSKVVRRAIGSLITGLQTMPSVAWTPLAIVLFRASGGDPKSAENAILFVLVIGAFPSVANGLIDGIDNIPPVLLRAGRVLGASGWTRFRYVVLPAALPTFVSGLKQAWAFAWRALMGAELIVPIIGVVSLGQQLEANRQLPDYPAMYADMIAVLIIGIAVDKLVFAPAERAIRKRYGLVDTAAA
jgi:NitT/TauT family transport system permease protein